MPSSFIRYVSPVNKTAFMNAIKSMYSYPRRIAFHTAEIYGTDKRPGGGGLGVLSSDWLQQCADQSLPIVGVSIVHKYLQHQKFDSNFFQHENYVDSGIDKNPFLTKLDKTINVNIQGREIPVSLYGQLLKGKNGGVLPIILMSVKDCGVEGFERITDTLYPGSSQDPFATLGQEMILGIGGVKALKELGIPIDLYHFNDCHPALGAIQILSEMGITPEKLDENALRELRNKIVYTSHTLVGAASDVFSADIFSDMVRDQDFRRLIGILGASPVDGRLKKFDEVPVYSSHIDMTGLAMFSAGKINAVSKLNGELLRKSFPQHSERIISQGGITNAVHPDWASKHIQEVYDKYAPDWRENPKALTSLSKLSFNAEFRKALWEAHSKSKEDLISYCKKQRNNLEEAGLDPEIFLRKLEPDVLTIGFARRVAGYKRHDLLVHDIDALANVFDPKKPVQFIFAGKAHPKDSSPGGGKYILQNLLQSAKLINEKYGDRIKILFLPNYDVNMARVLIPGVDVWLNNPIWGEEASGTSTMDAILNAVPLATTVDGCVPEMLTFGDVGWPFGIMKAKNGDRNYRADAYALYATLNSIKDLYYHSIKNKLLKNGCNSLWGDKMVSCVSNVAPYFLTQRMVSEYMKYVWNL